MNENLYILIMAGGEGTRFFPISTPEKPKQFLSFWGDRTFIQQTYDRIQGLVPDSNIYVATNDRYTGIVEEQLPNLNPENIIGETEKKNTAPCIAYACNRIYQQNKDSVVVVLPSDHLISNVKDFRGVIDRAVYIAKARDVLVTLGIQPTWAADCFGYIRMAKMIEDDPDGKWNIYTVKEFIEKPSVDKAKYYIADESFVWNSGMFIWKAGFVLNEIKKYLPEMHDLLVKYEDSSDLANFFSEVKSISIDYGVMERSERVVTIPCSIGWSDIGTWQSLYNLSKDNIVELEPHVEAVMKKELGLEV